MRGTFRLVWFLTVAMSLLVYVGAGRPILASETQDTSPFSGYVELNGPVQLQMAISPPIGRPRDKILVQITITNQLNEPVSPAVELALPPALSSTLARYPSGTTYNYQQNRLSWQPVLQGNGDSEQLTLEYTVSVADIRHPAQKIDVQLTHEGSYASGSANFWVGTAPSATIAIDKQVVAVGEPVQLRAVAAGPGPFTQTWHLGDGRQITASDPEVSFALPGIYEVRLQVANPLTSVSALSAVTVVSQPTASFVVSDEMPLVAQPVQFTNTSGGERPLQSYWDFGDGNTSQEANPVHTYSAPGDYEVRLSISSAFGQSEHVIPISVGAGPIADLVTPEEGRTGEPLQFMGFGDETTTLMRWDMGDGSVLEGDVVTHTYYRPGNYSVSLYATNAYGETQIQRQIVIHGGLYTTFAPYIVGNGDPAQLVESTGEVVSPAQPDAGQEPEVPTSLPVVGAIPEQSGSTLPVPGDTGSAVVPVPTLSVDLPAQAPLADDASAAEKLLWYVNEARRLHGLGPLTYSYELSIAAQHHTEDMADNPDIMHVGSDGSRPAERQQRFGYLGVYGGEAVAWGWEDPVPVVEFWVNSPPHRILILNPDANEIGVGHTADGFAPNIWYWAVEFGILP